MDSIENTEQYYAALVLSLEAVDVSRAASQLARSDTKQLLGICPLVGNRAKRSRHVGGDWKKIGQDDLITYSYSRSGWTALSGIHAGQRCTVGAKRTGCTWGSIHSERQAYGGSARRSTYRAARSHPESVPATCPRSAAPYPRGQRCSTLGIRSCGSLISGFPYCRETSEIEYRCEIISSLVGKHGRQQELPE